MQRNYKVKRIAGTWSVETPASVGTFASFADAVRAIADSEQRIKERAEWARVNAEMVGGEK